MDVIAVKPCFYKWQRKTGERFAMPRNFARQFIAARLVRPAPATAPATYSHRAVTETRRVDMVPQYFSPFDHDRDGRDGGSSAPDHTDELKAARADYMRITGKRFFPGWTAERLREMIAAHEASDD
jgi:hypothetical protein